MPQDNKMPVISVVIPTYNAANYLKETLDSVLAQDYDDFEIVIVDDCSTDQTKRIIDQYASEKIVYIKLERNHGGPSKARNVGINKAKGKYIALCDSDDILPNDRLSTAIKYLDQHPEIAMTFTDEVKFEDSTGAIIGNVLNAYDRFQALNKVKVNDEFYIIKNDDAFECLFYENYILVSGVTIRKTVFGDVGYFDESLFNSDDRDMWFRITRNYSIGFIERIGFKYRIRTSSISGRGPKLANSKIKVIEKQINYGLTSRLTKRAKEIISINLFGVGHYYQREGNMRTARKYYLDSISQAINVKSVKGIIITLIGNKIYQYIRDIKSKK
jgi:glycosyltransferase involved in cell wall biosynthesis